MGDEREEEVLYWSEWEEERGFDDHKDHTSIAEARHGAGARSQVADSDAPGELFFFSRFAICGR